MRNFDRSRLGTAFIAFLVGIGVAATLGAQQAPIAGQNPAAPQPHVVHLERGASYFEKGDNITVTQVLGTESKLADGQVYEVTGNYTLRSHGGATLGLSFTPIDPPPTYVEEISSMQAPGGSGSFRLATRIGKGGQLRLSFYEAQGPATLARAKGENLVDPMQNPRGWYNPQGNYLDRFGDLCLVESSFPQAVNAQQGPSTFSSSLGADGLTITRVAGASSEISPGQSYRVEGEYHLNSRLIADLGADVTPRKLADFFDDSVAGANNQISNLPGGDGTFSLVLPVRYAGYPHVQLRPAGGGMAIGNTYFGSGDSLAKSVPGSTLDFPYALPAVAEGESFARGDAIHVEGVRGTSKTFSAANAYLVKGNCVLASQQKAALGVYVAAGGTRGANRVDDQAQIALVTKGVHDFLLGLPINTGGIPYLALTNPAGQNFGGMFLKTKPDAFPMAVDFSLGQDNYVTGDSITITSVRGTSNQIAPKNAYVVTGTYTLASRGRAVLGAVVMNDQQPTSSEGYDGRYVVVDKGIGFFSLEFSVRTNGYPQVGFFDEHGNELGVLYFGTGLSVYYGNGYGTFFNNAPFGAAIGQSYGGPTNGVFVPANKPGSWVKTGWTWGNKPEVGPAQ